MYPRMVIPNTVILRISGFLIFLGPVTTLTITPWFNYDPINLGKCLLLVSISFAGFGLLLPYLRQVPGRVGNAFVLSLLFFFFALISPLLTTKANKAQQVWGQFGRATGILTYVSLLLSFFLVATVFNNRAQIRLLYSLVSTQVVMTIYCMFQLLQMDPIKWSSFATFGTLGNVNFLSGFLGISTVVSLSMSIKSEKSGAMRIFLLTLSFADIYIVATTDSIQGLVALSVGMSVFIGITFWAQGRIFQIPYLLTLFVGLVSLVMALLNQGPLKSLIYQVTVIYRADYMHAAIKMIQHNPLTGVGIDSYDDWYRTERGAISAFRTGLNRTANTAHNVMLDLGSGGGIPLLLAYLVLLGFVTLAIARFLKRGGAKYPVFVSLTCAWIAYQVQASVSINQVGVGIWGWLIGGAIIAYERESRHTVSKQKFSNTFEELSKSTGKQVGQTTRKKIPNSPPPLAVMMSVLLLGIGFTLAFIPLKVDMDFRSASSRGRLDEIMKVVSNPASNSFFLSQANSLALQNRYQQQAREINDDLISRYPRNLFGWKARLNLTDLGPTSKEEALNAIKEIDPYFGICTMENPALEIRKILLSLPGSKQYELAVGWGLAKSGELHQGGYRLDRVNSKALEERIQSYCMG